MRDFKTNLDADELIEIFDSAFNEYLVTYRPHDDPQLEYDKPITDKIKAELVAEALDKFFDLDIFDYVTKYVNSIDESEIKRRLEKDEEAERCEAMADRYID